MRLLVTGVSGYVGSLLAPALIGAGHDVRGFSRSPERVQLPGLDVRRGDAVSGEGLEAALEGVEVAYFLIHSMEAATGAAGSFPERELDAAHRFAEAATRADVRRIVYLGGPMPPGVPSRHLGSRLAVEHALLSAIPDSVALRASILIGARSRSFRLLVRLVERLPVLALPAWWPHRTAPIDERDILQMLVAAADTPIPVESQAPQPGHVLAAAGPDVVSYGELMQRIAAAMLVDRPEVRLPVSLTPVASVVAAALAGEDAALVRPLMESLETDLLVSGRPAEEVLSVRLHRLDAAIEHALSDWELAGPLAAR